MDAIIAQRRQERRIKNIEFILNDAVHIMACAVLASEVTDIKSTGTYTFPESPKNSE